MTFEAPDSSVPGVEPGSILDGRVPDGDPRTAWERRRLSYKLVNPNNRRKFRVIVVGTGLAGAGAAAGAASVR